MSLLDDILSARGITGAFRDSYLQPDYEVMSHDPFLLPDMQQAVDRLVAAHGAGEQITIYGDYDIDGLTATTVLIDALDSFGFQGVSAYIPNRFVEGYGLTADAVRKVAEGGATLMITVDCGSLSEQEISLANSLGLDVIVTDHHNVAKVQPPAVAVINPKRLLADYPAEYEDYILKQNSKMSGKIYPFLDLPGVGVAFKLVQALQQKIPGLPKGQEKWLLDLVALGTVCDVVNLTDENRTNVYWGLKVLEKTRRNGLRALMKVSDIKSGQIDSSTLGFRLGPRMNASGRLETAEYTLQLLTADKLEEAHRIARKLDVFNTSRKSIQNAIYKEAVTQAGEFSGSSVLVLAGEGWNHGVIGIVAAKILERFHKPAFVLEIMGDEAKGSARSFGDFSAADAIRSCDDIITKGGGHKLAAGVTLPADNIDAFRLGVNKFYDSLSIKDQASLLLPQEDVVYGLDLLDIESVEELSRMEPFGSGNKEPIIRLNNLFIQDLVWLGAEKSHLKLTVADDMDRSIKLIWFSAPTDREFNVDDQIDVWFHPSINEWNGRRSLEGRLLHVKHVK